MHIHNVYINVDAFFSYSFSLLQLLRKLFINLDLLETFSHFAFPPFLICHLLLLINCLLFAFVFISLLFFLHSIYFWTGFSLFSHPIIQHTFSFAPSIFHRFQLRLFTPLPLNVRPSEFGLDFHQVYL